MSNRSNKYRKSNRYKIESMFKANTNYAQIAYESVLFFIKTGQARRVENDQIPADLKLKRSCFVAIYEETKLRGLAGEIEITKENLYDEIIDNAILAATENSLNGKITETDLHKIRTEVYLVSSLSSLTDVSEIKPAKHGLCLRAEKNIHFILPFINKFKTPEQMIQSLFKKAKIKYDGKLDQYEIKAFKVTKYD